MKLFTLSPLHHAILIALVATNAMAKDKPQKNDENTRKLDTIVVTDKKLSKSDNKAEAKRAAVHREVNLSTGGVTFIDIAEMRDRRVASLSDFFRYVPGVWAPSQNGNDLAYFSSRGSNLGTIDYDGNGVKFLQDGLPVTAADGNNHSRLIDPLAAQYATVARGANAMKYGASTLGGAVDFTTPTAYNNPMARLSLSGGSFGEILGRATVSKVFNDQFDGLLTVEAKTWDGYRDHNKQDRVGVYGNFGWQISDAITNRTYISYIKNDQQLPGQLTMAQFNANPRQAMQQALGGNYQLNTETERVANKTTWTIDNRSSLEVGFSFENQHLYHPIVDKVMVDFGSGPMDMFSMLVDSTQKDWGTSARYNLHLDAHDILVGMNFGTNSEKGGNYRNNGGFRNGLTNQITKKADNIEIFAQDHWHISENWILTPALQGVFAYRNVNNVATNTYAGFYPPSSNPKANYQGINPSLGLMYNLTKTGNLYANVSRLYQPPTNYNLADNTITNPNSNNALKATEGTSIEIGTRGTQNFSTLNSMKWELSLYYSWLNKEILSVSPMQGLSLATNINKTIHAGIEGLIGGQFAIDDKGTHSIAPMMTFTVNHFNFDNDPIYGNNRLPAAPNYFLKGEVLYRHACGFFIGPTFDATGKRYADFANTYKVSGYGLLGMRTGWSNEHYKVFFEGRNLLDKNYVSSLSVQEAATANSQILNVGVPISFFGGVEVSF